MSGSSSGHGAGPVACTGTMVYILAVPGSVSWGDWCWLQKGMPSSRCRVVGKSTAVNWKLLGWEQEQQDVRVISWEYLLCKKAL